MGKEFDLAVSLTVIDKGFKKSAGDGLFAIKQETTNAVTRAREILAPKAASFEQFYEAVNGHLHWLDDKLSVEHHLRRYSAWLKARNTPVELINQSQLDRDVWSVVEPRVLKLEDGQALFWLAMRTADAANGVALQQIKKDNGKLIQNSQLLPFDKLAEIEDFLGLLSSGREEASIAVSQDSGLSAVGGWIVEGDSIDFDKNLPALIDQTIQPNLIPAMMTERVFQLRSLPVIQSTEPAPVTVELSVEQPIEPEKSVPVTTADSFWFGAAAVSAVAVMPNVVERSVPVFSAKDITSQEPTKIIPLGLDAVEPRVKQETGVVPTRRVLVGQKIVKPIAQKTEKRVERGIEIQTTQPKPKLSAEQTVVFKVTPTRIISVGPEQIETVIEKSSTLLYSDRHIKASDMKKVPSGRVPEGKPGKNQREVVYHSALPPIYKIPQIQFKPDVLNENEIPLWQMSVDPDKDLNIFMLTMFFLLVNTKWLRLDEGFPIVRGSGFRNF